MGRSELSDIRRVFAHQNAVLGSNHPVFLTGHFVVNPGNEFDFATAGNGILKLQSLAPVGTITFPAANRVERRIVWLRTARGYEVRGMDGCREYRRAIGGLGFDKAPVAQFLCGAAAGQQNGQKSKNCKICL